MRTTVLRMAAVLTAAAAVVSAGSAEAGAKPAQCDIYIHGYGSYLGSCEFNPLGKGSFSVKAELTSPNPNDVGADFVTLTVVKPGVAKASVIGGAHAREDQVGTVYRKGACWVAKPSGDFEEGADIAKICVK